MSAAMTGRDVQDPFAKGWWLHTYPKILKRAFGLSRGQNVIIETSGHTLPSAELLAEGTRQLGIHPVIFYVPERAWPDGQGKARAADSGAISRVELNAIRSADGFVSFPVRLEDFTQRSRLPPAFSQAIAQRELERNHALVRNSIPSTWLLAASATPNEARQFGVNAAEWQREALRASVVDPRVLQRNARPLARRLERGHRVTITHPNGTHLELGLLGRTPAVDDGIVDPKDLEAGRVWTVVPAGSLAVAVDERVGEGRLVANRPSRHLRGVIQGTRWTFRAGRLARHEIESGAELFEERYRQAGRERDRPALLLIGLNPEIRDFPLAEDQELGVVTVDIGYNDDFGGRSRGSFREYTLLRGADVLIDDQPLLRAGRLA